jgi:hypothetical protein
MTMAFMAESCHGDQITKTAGDGDKQPGEETGDIHL